MKVLITGACGYIGGYLTDLLSVEGKYDITAYDNLLFEDRYLKDVDFIKGDIRDYKKLGGIVNNYDAVIWLAGLVGDGACAVNPALTKEINTDTVKWLVDNYNGKIIFPSTCSVYGKNDDILDEDSPTNPLSAYAATKLEAEQYLLEKKPDSLIFRLGTLFGIGDEHSRLRLDLVANILSMRASKGETLSVFSGSQWRPMLHVRDVSTAIKHGLDNDVEGLYNLSYKNYRIAELAEEIVGLVPGSGIEYSEMPFEDQRNYKVKNDNILATGWKPTLELKDGVKQIKWAIQQDRIKDPTDPVYHNALYMNKGGVDKL